MSKKRVHPLRTYHISPSDIKYLIKSGGYFSVRDTGTVKSGSWDCDPRIFREYEIYTMIYDRFVNGKRWSETNHYKKCEKKVMNNEECWHGCSSIEDLDKRCETLDTIYQSMKEAGYCQQKHQSSQTDERSIYPMSAREISIGIGRNGDIILIDGRHRLSIADILDVRQVPVHVCVVHAQWSGGLPQEIYK